MSGIAPEKDESSGRLWLIATMALSAIIIVVGAVVMFGWVIKSSLLVQIHPEFAPMQFNTALCFFLSGIGLMCLLKQWNRQAAIFGSITTIISLLTICQYMFDINLGIDELAIEHAIVVKTSHPGRMAPNTALCFLLFSSAIIVGTINKTIDRSFPVSILSGAVFALSTVALIGYMLDTETAYGWGSLTRMAIHTSIGFMMLGVGITIWAWKHDHRQPKNVIPSWAPFQIGLVLLTIFLLWQAVSKEEGRLLRTAVNEQAKNAASIITLELNFHDNALKRMAERWHHRPNPSETEWQSDADNYLQDVTGLVGLALLDADYNLVLLRSSLPESESYGFHATENKNLRAMLNQTQKRNEPASSEVQLPGNQMAWLTCIPTQHEDGQFGYLVALQKIDPLMSRFLHEGHINGDYSLELLSGDNVIFSYAAYGSKQSRDISRTIDLDRSDRDWRVVVTPGERITLSYEARLPMVLAVSEIVVIVLAIFAIRLMRDASRQAEELRLANEKLHQTVEEKTQLENRIKRSNTALMRKNEDMEQVIYSVSHDLQAPLVSIVGFTGFVEDDLKSGKLEQVSESIDCIKNASKQMQENLDDLLVLSRIGRSEGDQVRVDLHDLTAAVVQTLQPQIDERNISLNIDENLPSIIANPKQMAQLLENLLSNSIKYGCVNESPKIDIGFEEKKERTLIHIQDNGPGIPKDHQSQIFRLFQRMDVHNEQSGTGLGLSIARRVVDTLDGDIYVDPNYDEGARFVIDLPNTVLTNGHMHT